jgi:hypothetical protein
MKSIKLFTMIACTLAILAATTVSVNAESCCEKAKKAGKECQHKCCVEAKKAGKVCEKCNPKSDKK